MIPKPNNISNDKSKRKNEQGTRKRLDFGCCSMTEPAKDGLDILVEHVEIVTVIEGTCFFTNDFSTKGHVTSQPQPPTLRIGFFQCHYQKNSIVTHTNWIYKPQFPFLYSL